LASGDKFWVYDAILNPDAQRHCQEGIDIASTPPDLTNQFFEQGYDVWTFNDGLYCYKWYGTSTIQATIDTIRTACI
jgi:hypothetical protein